MAFKAKESVVRKLRKTFRVVNRLKSNWKKLTLKTFKINKNSYSQKQSKSKFLI